VVGIGHPDRGDDAVGPLVADAVRSARPDLDVVALSDPSVLVDVMSGRSHVVVVDASVTGMQVGTMQTFDAAAAALPTLSVAVTSSHALSLGDAIELTRAMGSLPKRLEVVAVEIGSVMLGQPAHPAVLAAVTDAGNVVLRLVGPADAHSDDDAVSGRSSG
jgi:hydrogenase maturation protease